MRHKKHNPSTQYLRGRTAGRREPVNASDLQDVYHYALMALGGDHYEYGESSFNSRHKPTASERKKWATKARAVLRRMGIVVPATTDGEALVKIARDTAARIGYDAYSHTKLAK
jgi:hypothetical protein